MSASKRGSPLANAGAYELGQALRGIVGQAEHHLGVRQHLPPASLLLFGAPEVFGSPRVAGEPGRGKEIRLVLHVETAIDGLDIGH